MSPAIRMHDLGKQYRLGELEPYKTLRDAIAMAVRRPSRITQNGNQGHPSNPLNRHAGDRIWALRNVTLDVETGEVVGIIGRNGAGKSTLLKLLSRITDPTEGWAEIRGRVGSLLEVGTGFHPELTGKENIFLNGAILGMNRVEIRSKMEAIIAFSELGDFMDTPVKRYSSGMYVRLAFAVAAHLEPDILFVDEVLAVGDPAFQRKCLGKISEVAEGGRTVLFVSHNMAAVSALCSRVIALKQGHVWADGSADVIQDYWNSVLESPRVDLGTRIDLDPTKRVWLTGVWFSDRHGKEVSVAFTGQELVICMEFRSRSGDLMPDFAVGIYDRLGRSLVHCDMAYSMPPEARRHLPRRGIVRCRIRKFPLVEGEYTVNVLVHRGKDQEDHVAGAAKLVVERGDFHGTGNLAPASYAPFLAEHSWEFDAVDAS